jgi:hypothetical protein
MPQLPLGITPQHTEVRLLTFNTGSLGRWSLRMGEILDPTLQECPSGFTSRAAPLIVATYRRSDSAVQGD